MKDCNGCREWGSCIYALHVYVLCPCHECIVKVTCQRKDKQSCISYKRFKKKYLEEVLVKTKLSDFETKIPIKKRRGRK